MILAKGFLDLSTQHRLQEDLNDLEVGKVVKINRLNENAVEITTDSNFPKIAATLFHASMRDGMLRVLGWDKLLNLVPTTDNKK